MKSFPKLALLAILFFFSFITFSSCTKEDPYDPSGKCGSVLSSTPKTFGLTALFEIKVSMDDGHIQLTVSPTPYSLGDRVCF